MIVPKRVVASLLIGTVRMPPNRWGAGARIGGRRWTIDPETGGRPAVGGRRFAGGARSDLTGPQWVS